MALFKPYKIVSSKLNSLPKKEGQLIITTDTKKIYLDTSSTNRILLNEDVDVVTYTLSKNGNSIVLTGSDGNSTTVTDNNTTYSVATTDANGLMSSADKTKLNGIAEGAQKNTITGVKGNSESSYRTGNVNITKTNIGLGNVENKSSATIRGEITSGNVTTALGYTPLNSNLKGANNGVAELDENGKVISAQLPSYVDDVLEYAAKANFPATGEAGKIYVDKATNKTWRWGGSAYAEISPSLALGTTSSTAFRGDQGKTAYDHANAKGSAFTSGLYKITTNAQGHVTAATAVQKSDITALGIPGQDTNTTYSVATASANGLMSKEDKTKLDGIDLTNIPNNSNLVNGSADGSLKGINTRDDDSSYTIGTNAFAIGDSTRAKGENSFVSGRSSYAYAANSHAEGYITQANAENAHAEGNGAIAQGTASHAEGTDSTAYGADSHAEGNGTTANEKYSHAEGFKTTASGMGSHAEGGTTKSIGDYSHAEGSGSQAQGLLSHAEGNVTIAGGDSSHAEGYMTQASAGNSHAEGDSTVSSGLGSHAEGHSSQSKGNYSHAEGESTVASGMYSHAEGLATKATGENAHAEGSKTTAKGADSHAEGTSTIASGYGQHVQGRINIEDTEDRYAHIIGNGDGKGPSNAHTVDWHGNAWYKGNIRIKGTSYDDAIPVSTQQVIVSMIEPTTMRTGDVWLVIEASNEEKAIAVAKVAFKEYYGSLEGVTFNITGTDGGNIVVSVNDSSTTNVLVWYTIDPTTETIVDERWT